MLYYFYCPKCGYQEYHTEKPLHGCIPNIRDGHGYPIYHYPCPKCKNERAGYMEERTGNIDEVIYYRSIIGLYQKEIQ